MWTMLRKASPRQVVQLQIYGDSKLVIDCLKLGKPPWDVFLLPLYEDIDRARILFQRLSFQHIFREINSEADLLSKKGLLLPTGSINIWELTDGFLKLLAHSCY